MDLARSYPQFAIQLTEWNYDVDGIRLVRRAYDECLTLFAARYRASGKSFCDHLVGTASGVVLGGGDPAVVSGALIHAAYDAADFGDGLTGDSRRHRKYVADSLGTEVEDLVHRYHELGWSPTIAQGVWDSIDHLSETERKVVLIRVANELDDVIDGGLVVSSKRLLPVYQGHTLEIVSRIAEHVADAPFATYVRTVMADPFPDVRDELILGSIGSRMILPKSVRVRFVIRSMKCGLAIAHSGKRSLRRNVISFGHRRSWGG